MLTCPPVKLEKTWRFRLKCERKYATGRVGSQPESLGAEIMFIRRNTGRKTAHVDSQTHQPIESSSWVGSAAIGDAVPAVGICFDLDANNLLLCASGVGLAVTRGRT